MRQRHAQPNLRGGPTEDGRADAIAAFIAAHSADICVFGPTETTTAMRFPATATIRCKAGSAHAAIDLIYSATQVPGPLVMRHSHAAVQPCDRCGTSVFDVTQLFPK